MSINVIRRRIYDAIIKQTVCDDCKVVLREELGDAHDHVGSTLLVANWCKDCSQKHSFPLGTPVFEDVGVSIGNPNAIAKVRIEK